MKKILIFIFACFIVTFLAFGNRVLAFSASSNTIYNGIDISQWQGRIDFYKVKNDGIEIAYIKATQGNSHVDPYFDRNYTESVKYGIKIGVYHYLTAKNIDEAIDEANYFCSIIGNKKINCKLAMDFESFRGLSKTEINNISKAFLEKVRENTGKEVVIYSDAYNAKNVFDEELARKYPIWVAEYGVKNPTSNDKWNSWIGFQYADNGRISGIKKFVDKDYYTSDIFLTDETVIKETNHRNRDLSRTIEVRVRRGNTLSQLAVKYKTSVDLIVEYNNIKNRNIIYIGQILDIPYSNYDEKGETNHIIYNVKRGDTLSAIARKYNVTVKELVKLNNIKNPDLIYVGETIKIRKENIK